MVNLATFKFDNDLNLVTITQEHLRLLCFNTNITDIGNWTKLNFLNVNLRRANLFCCILFSLYLIVAKFAIIEDFSNWWYYVIDDDKIKSLFSCSVQRFA